MTNGTARRSKMFAGLWILMWIGGGVATWLGGWELVKQFVEATDARTIWAQAYVVATAILIVIAFAWREWQTLRKERYANITTYLHEIQHGVRDLLTYIECEAPPQGAAQTEFDAFFEMCRNKTGAVLDRLTSIFVSLTSTRCRASVKLVYRVDQEVYYYTLARDTASLRDCLDVDNWRVENDHDPLKNNAQFSQLFDDTVSVWHYFSNNLMKDRSFRSTSFTAYDRSWGETGVAPQGLWRNVKAAARNWWAESGPDRREWPLPYRSTIACTMRQGPTKLAPNQKAVVLGFVTIDSESRGVFEERWDVPLLFGVADSLYHVMRKYLEIQNAVASAGTRASSTAGTSEGVAKRTNNRMKQTAGRRR